MELPVFTEGDAGDLFTVRFFDTDSELETPTTVTYRVDCVTNDEELVEDTSVTPASSISLYTTADWTQIVDDTLRYEMRRLSVTAAGTDWQKTKYVLFKVKNAKRL